MRQETVRGALLLCSTTLLLGSAVSPQYTLAAQITGGETGAAYSFTDEQPSPYLTLEEGMAMEPSGTVARNWPPTRTGYEQGSGVPADVETGFWADAGGLTLGLFARAASARSSYFSAEYGNTVTVLPGTSGLADGDPVTLQLVFRHAGIASVRGSYAIVDIGARVDLQGLDEAGPAVSDTVSYGMGLEYWGSGATLEGTLGWGWNLDKNGVEQAADALPTADRFIPALDDTVCPGPGTYRYLCGLDREFDTGSQTVTLDTFVGARLWVNAHSSITATAWSPDEIAVADFSDPFQVALSPAAGFEGVVLAWDVQPLVQDDAATTDQGAAVSVPVLANDRVGVSVRGVTQGANGAVTANADGTATYTPDPGFSGADTFTYTAGPVGDAAVAETATVTVTVNAVTGPAADLTVAIADTPDPVAAGAALTYTVIVTNQGPEAAANASLGITLPALRAGAGPARVFLPWVEFVSATPSLGSCTESDLVLSCALGDLAAGETATIQVEVRPLTSGQVLSTAAAVASDLADPAPADNAATATTTVTAAADLSVTITDTPDPFESGQPGVRPVLYTVTLANAGPNAAEAVVLDVNVTDDREGLTPVSVTVTGAAPFTDGTCTITGERTVRCEAASLTSGGSLSFNVQANLQSTSAVWATATVVSSSEDPDPINNSAREDTRGATYLDLELTASGGGAIYRGTRVTYSFQVTNHGPGPGSGSNRSPFSFVFPEGFVLVEIPTGDPKCTQEGQTVSCYSYLAAGASVSGEITVTAPGSPGDFEVLALLDHDTGDYHDTAPGNNGLILATPVVGEADFTAAGIEVSQGIQNLANDMPLVAGRATVVRGYASSSAHIRGVPGRLRGFRGGIEVEGSPLMPGNAGGAYLRPDGGARTDPYQGWWFVLPQTWRSATLELSLEVDPDEALPDPDRTDNTVATTVTFHPGEVLNLAVVPMHLHQGADPDQPEITFFASDPDFPTMFQAMQRYHPVGWVNLWIRDRPLFPRGHARGNDWNLRFADTGGKMLNRLQRFRLSANDPVADLHYMGMVDPRADSPHMGGLGQRPGHVAWTEMSRSPAAADTETAWYQPGGKTLAHELGHNLGLRHVPCKGDEAGADEAYPWPFPECRLSAADPAGYFGLDVFFGQGELWGDYPAVISNDPNDEAWNVAYPMMGYAVPRWSSPYEYCQLLVDYGIPCTLDSASGLPTAARVLSGGGEGLSRRAFDLATATRHLAVSGTIDAAARTVEMDPPLLLTSPNATAVADAIAQLEQGEDSGYMVAQLDASGAVLDEQPLYRGVVEAGMTAWAFTQLLEAFEGVAAVEVRHAGGTLARAEASAAPPTVQLLAPAGGSIEDGAVVRWASADPDGDALEFTLYYSPDGGAGWFPLATGLDTGEYDLGSLRDLPGSTRGRFRVVVYDGFHTAVDDSDADLTVPGSNPVPVILQPGDQASVEEGTPVFLRGLATDPDQGSLGPDALVWSSDRDGALGSGVDLATGALSPGRHIVTLAATDDQGGFGATSITLIVGQDDGGLQPPDSDDGGSSGGGPCFIEMLGGQMGMNWRRLFLVLTGLAVVAYPRRS